MSILRESAKRAPHCFGCLLQNPNGDLLCLSHSNELRHGRGHSHKSLDFYGAIICQRCHDICDGRTCLEKTQEERVWLHRYAHDRTLAWWINEGYLVVTQP